MSQSVELPVGVRGNVTLFYLSLANCKVKDGEVDREHFPPSLLNIPSL